MPIGNVIGNHGFGLREVSNASVLASAQNNKDYVLYRRKKHFLSEALFYVKYENRTYAVLPVDEITVTQDEAPKNLMLIGYVYKGKAEENDLTDIQGMETEQKYALYKLKRTLYVQLPNRETVCAPMVKVS